MSGEVFTGLWRKLKATGYFKKKGLPVSIGNMSTHEHDTEL